MLGCADEVEVRQLADCREVGDRNAILDAPFVLARHLALDGGQRERLAQRQLLLREPRRAGCRVGPGRRSVAAASASRGAFSWGHVSPSQKLPPATAAYASSGRSSSGFGRSVSAEAGRGPRLMPTRCARSVDPRVPAGVLDVLSDDVRPVINAHPTAADHHPVRARRSAATARNRRWCRPPPHSRRGPSGSRIPQLAERRPVRARAQALRFALEADQRDFTGGAVPPPVRDLALPPRQMRLQSRPALEAVSCDGVPLDVAYAALVLPLRRARYGAQARGRNPQ